MKNSDLQQIVKKYSKYGVTKDMVKAMVQDGIDNGINVKAAIIGARMILAQTFGEHEYFTSQDVATVTGETVEEVNKRIELNEEELFKSGGMIKLSQSPFLS